MRQILIYLSVTFAAIQFFTLSGVVAQTKTSVLLGDFKEDWQNDWVERKLAVKPTKYQVKTEDDSNRVLKATSIDAASGLWRLLDIRPGQTGKLRWRWKIDQPLSKDTAEDTKGGDDYVARVYVVFGPHFVSWKTRAICYVWAANKEVGASYKNPYAAHVRTIVIQSGKENRNEWIREERNFVADYRKAFNKHPEMVSAVAVMVDTDNTNQVADAWFDDISIEVSDPATDAAKRKNRIKL